MSGGAAQDGAALLRVRDLVVRFPGPGGAVAVVDGMSLQVNRGETLGVMGESGSGKTLAALAVLRLVPAPGVVEGAVELAGTNLLSLSEREMRAIRGRRIGMVFQDPAAALHPVRTAGDLLVETVRARDACGRAEARGRAEQLLADAGLAPRTMRLHAHELSGGQRQRVAIALALAGRPELLLADEPTSALDATVQAQILGLLARLRADRGLSMLFVSHDPDVVAALCDRVVVLYAGAVVETGPVREVFERPRHPFTAGLLRCRPSAAPPVAGRLDVLQGSVPPPHRRPSGCRFRNRCDRAIAECAEARPPLRSTETGAVACLRAEGR